MPAKNEDLHGNVPDKSNVALLLIDVINDLEFESGEELSWRRHLLIRNAHDKRIAANSGLPSRRLGEHLGDVHATFGW